MRWRSSVYNVYNVYNVYTFYSRYIRYALYTLYTLYTLYGDTPANTSTSIAALLHWRRGYGRIEDASSMAVLASERNMQLRCMMRCSACGLPIEEEDARFCPHCGESLDALSTNLSFERSGPAPWQNKGTIPSQPIHEAPTRISAGSLPPGRRSWGSPSSPSSGLPEAPATNAAFYGAEGAGEQASFRELPRRAAAPPPAARRKRGAGIAVGVLIGLMLFGSGVGVGVLIGKAQPQPPLATSKSSTPTPFPSPTATPVEQVIFTDPLTAPTHPWNNDGSHCVFKNGSYHILRDFICSAPLGVESDIAVSVQVRQVAGTVGAFFGISLRFAGAGSFYAFLISSNSTWLLEKAVNSNSTDVVAQTINPAIKPGLNSSNTLLVRVQGAHFDFLVNGTDIGQANDTTFSAGLVGLIGADSADVAFNNFQVATLT